MKKLKKFMIGSGLVAAALVGGTGFYNSNQMNDLAVFNQDHGIKFAKRLDEMNGEFIAGNRAAASVPTENWKPLTVKESKKVAKKETVKTESIKEVASNIPAPAINDLRETKLTAALVNKKALQVGKDVYGTVEVVDGVIESLHVTLPGGNRIDLYANERMVGNVFQYEDTQTGEMKSGLLYEVEKGKKYMVTLANDSQFPGARLEFETNGAEIAYGQDYYEKQESWNLNSQNEEDNYAVNADIQQEQDVYESENQYKEENLNEQQEQNDTASFKFNFNASV